MKKLKQRLGRWMIYRGMKMAGKPPEISQTTIKEVEGKSTSGVIEANDVPRWQPEQHGNVIIAEPDIIKEFKRNNG